MIYGSVCSGIEAATVAWRPLGWKAAFFSEIEKFPSAVLAHHYPDIPNHGDMTKFKEWPDAAINVLVGGTPCQSFSVAGLRKGLDDPRGNLMLTFGAIAAKYRPTWLVWENVPGVLSSNKGQDFASFLGLITGQHVEPPASGKWKSSGALSGIESAYGISWRILDAQYFGVAQRRRRVFVVANLGNWRPAAAVLFERESMLRNPPPSREAGQEAAGTLASRTTGEGFPGTDEACSGYVQPVAFGGENCSGPIDVATPCNAHEGRQDFASETFVTQPIHDKATRHAGKRGDKQDGAGNGLYVGKESDPMYTLTKGDRHAVAVQPQGITIHGTDKTARAVSYTDVAGCLRARPPGSIENSSTTAVLQPVESSLVPYEQQGRRIQSVDGVAPTLMSNPAGGMKLEPVLSNMAVRRLTPIECERLQGFKDNYTLIPWKLWQQCHRKGWSYEDELLKRGMHLRGPSIEECPDGPRYKALGNSMAVPVMRWIGERIAKVDKIINQDAA